MIVSKKSNSVQNVSKKGCSPAAELTLWRKIYLVFIITSGHLVSFILKKEKKITASYKEALTCLVRSAVSHVGDVYSLFSFLLDSPQN